MIGCGKDASPSAKLATNDGLVVVVWKSAFHWDCCQPLYRILLQCGTQEKSSVHPIVIVSCR